MAQFDPDAADAVKAIRRTTAQVLIVHGTNDWIVPHRQSERLHAAAPDHSQLVSIPWLGHVALWLDPGGQVAAQARAWFDRYLLLPGPPGPISTERKPQMKGELTRNTSPKRKRGEQIASSARSRSFACIRVHRHHH